MAKKKSPGRMPPVGKSRAQVRQNEGKEPRQIGKKKPKKT